MVRGGYCIRVCSPRCRCINGLTFINVIPTAPFKCKLQRSERLRRYFSFSDKSKNIGDMKWKQTREKERWRGKQRERDID